MRKTYLLFLLLINFAWAKNQYRFEGFYQDYDGERRFELISLFLPYNPNVLVIPHKQASINLCARTWPEGALQSSTPLFLWVDDPHTLQMVQKHPELLNTPLVLYLATQLATYPTLKAYLESKNFSLLSHWYWAGKNGHAIFLKKELLQTYMNSINSSATTIPFFPLASRSGDLSPFLRKIQDKPSHHRIDEIDYIYMINLDERPEKFKQSSNQLAKFGIHPYRFSAMNGWQLTTDTLDRIGVQFLTSPPRPLMGTVYRNARGKEYRSNEWIEQGPTSYFCHGMPPGSIGIVLSHLSVLQDAYDSGYQTIWVMEDDIEVIDNPLRLNNLIRSLDRLVPDWDVLFTDPDTKDKKGNYVPCRSLALRPNIEYRPLSHYLSRFYPISNEFSSLGMRYGAYSMILRRTGIKKILDYFNQFHIYLPYDMDFWLIPDLKMVQINRDIVSTIPDALSDNSAPGYVKQD